MKRIIATIGLYALLLILNQSCGPEHFLITDIRFSSATLQDKADDRQSNYYVDTTVFTKDIVFVISYYGDYVACIRNGFSSECYAFTKESVNDNRLLEETYSLQFDQPFVFLGDTVDENQNIFEITQIKNEIEIFESYMVFNGMGADQVIEFSDFFLNNSAFNEDICKVTFYCKTSDSLEFEKSINVEFKLNE